jgi:hypothetical protein
LRKRKGKRIPQLKAWKLKFAMRKAHQENMIRVMPGCTSSGIHLTQMME